MGYFLLDLKFVVREIGKAFQDDFFHQNLQPKYQVMLKSTSFIKRAKRKIRREKVSTK